MYSIPYSSAIKHMSGAHLVLCVYVCVCLLLCACVLLLFLGICVRVRVYGSANGVNFFASPAAIPRLLGCVDDLIFLMVAGLHLPFTIHRLPSSIQHFPLAIYYSEFQISRYLLQPFSLPTLGPLWSGVKCAPKSRQR